MTHHRKPADESSFAIQMASDTTMKELKSDVSQLDNSTIYASRLQSEILSTYPGDNRYFFHIDLC